MKELKQIAQAYNVKKKFKTKQELFDYLNENNFI